MVPPIRSVTAPAARWRSGRRHEKSRRDQAPGRASHHVGLLCNEPRGATAVLFQGTTDAGGLIRKNRQDAVVKLALVGFDTASHQLVWEVPCVTETGHLDRRFFGTTNITRSTSEAELTRNSSFPLIEEESV